MFAYSADSVDSGKLVVSLLAVLCNPVVTLVVPGISHVGH